MPFQPGNKLGKGRPKGSTNQLAEQAKIRISRVANEGLDHIKEDLDKIRKQNPAEAAKIYLKLLEYVIPKLKSIDMDVKGEVEHRIEKISVEIKNGINSSDK